ncbi:MAG: hypothetical protein ACSHXY_01185 [Alphaproteobacteria bacterium]
MLLSEEQTDSLLNLASYLEAENSDFPDDIQQGFKVYLNAEDSRVYGKIVVGSIGILLAAYKGNMDGLDDFLDREIGWSPAPSEELEEHLVSIQQAISSGDYRLAEF